jgi:hypothetical protein
MPAPTEEELKTIRDLAAQGISGKLIGEKLGRSPNSIAGICHRNGIKLCARKRGDVRKVTAAKARAKARPKAKPKKKEEWVNPSTMTKAERARRAGEAQEREEERKATIEDRLMAAAAGALRLPLVTVTKGKGSTIGGQKKAPKIYRVDGLKMDQCRFPLTDEPPHLFCAKPCLPDSPYCPDHHPLCHSGQTVKLPKWLVPKDAG